MDQLEAERAEEEAEVEADLKRLDEAERVLSASNGRKRGKPRKK